MARLLALDWDQLEARIVVARPKGDGIAVEKAVAVPMNLSAQQGDFEELSEQLTTAIRNAGISKCESIVAIGRSQIELGRLMLPPAPDDELPEMVRFQAMREFSSLQDSSPLDFVPLGDAGKESGEVMAAAIPLALAQQLQKVLTGHGHEPKRTVMRPCAAASLAMRRQPTLRTSVGLIISQQADSAELAVVKHGLVVFTRSFRLPPDWMPGESGEPLLGEVRRTIAAAQNQLGDSRVELIAMFGTPAQHSELCDRLRDRTKLDVVLLDPFDGVTGDSPIHPERFAAAIGMLTDETNSVAPIIDFSNPRKTPEPENHSRKRAFYGGIAAAVLLCLLGLLLWKYRGLDKQISIRNQQLAKLKNDVKNLDSTVQLAKSLNEWKQADRNWLDLLAHLSDVENLTADDFMLDSIQGRTNRENRGELRISGKSRDMDAQHTLHAGLSDDVHHPESEMAGPIQNVEDDRYQKMFKTKIFFDKAIPIVPITPPPQPQAAMQESPDEKRTDEPKEAV